MKNDIYCQTALLTIVGLSTKNSLLIVEFARKLHKGAWNLSATVTAAKQRLVPFS